jgi:hypothetical protein
VARAAPLSLSDSPPAAIARAAPCAAASCRLPPAAVFAPATVSAVWACASGTIAVAPPFVVTATAVADALAGVVAHGAVPADWVLAECVVAEIDAAACACDPAAEPVAIETPEVESRLIAADRFKPANAEVSEPSKSVGWLWEVSKTGSVAETVEVIEPSGAVTVDTIEPTMLPEAFPFEPSEPRSRGPSQLIEPRPSWPVLPYCPPEYCPLPNWPPSEPMPKLPLPKDPLDSPPSEPSPPS